MQHHVCLNSFAEYLLSTNFVDVEETPTVTKSSGNSPHSSQATAAYELSTEADTEFDTSDDKPVAKYRNRSKSNSKKTDKDNSDAEPSRGRGRPRGKVQPRKQFQTAGFNKSQRNVRRESVDEECARLGIVYRRWKPLNPNQESHPSIMFYDDDTVVPEEQKVPDWCILCPRNKLMRDKAFCHTHYLKVHHKKLIVVQEYKMLSCKCSEIRSHGSDRRARNKHYHCYQCFHPFKSSDFLATHIITNHPEVDLPEIRHLMRKSNPHRAYDYEQ